MDATSIAAGVRAGHLSAREVTAACLERVRAADAALNCFTSLLTERALRAAESVDEAVARGADPGPLAGVPFAMKDLFDTAGNPTRAGSKIHRDAPPASEDAFVVQRLIAAGAIPLGLTNMDEYAYGFVTENAHYGDTHNPRDPRRMAGGSSGGSAAAVAAGFTPISLGSDTNGSVRVPAAFCGVFGLKPTFGRLSRRGVFPFASSLDHVGCFARSVADLARTYDVMQGHDPLDPAQTARPVESALAHLDAPPRGLRISVLDGWFRQGATPEALAAVDLVASGPPRSPGRPLTASPLPRAGTCTLRIFARGRPISIRPPATAFSPAHWCPPRSCCVHRNSGAGSWHR
jgi:AtzE family amidohydrolase